MSQKHKYRRYWWQLWLPKWTLVDEAIENEEAIADLSGTPEVFKGGRVTKVKSAPEYDPDNRVKGGKIVRTMPRQLRKLKEAQEAKTE